MIGYLVIVVILELTTSSTDIGTTNESLATGLRSGRPQWVACVDRTDEHHAIRHDTLSCVIRVTRATHPQPNPRRVHSPTGAGRWHVNGCLLIVLYCSLHGILAAQTDVYLCTYQRWDHVSLFLCLRDWDNWHKQLCVNQRLIPFNCHIFPNGNAAMTHINNGNEPENVSDAINKNNQ